MSDIGAFYIAWALAIGLTMNGCVQTPQSIHEAEILDEATLVGGLIEAACYLSGREWETYKCQEPPQ